MIGIEIKNARKRHKVTQEYLANKSGVSKSFISRIESGSETPSVPTLFKLLDALGLELKIVSKRVS